MVALHRSSAAIDLEGGEARWRAESAPWTPALMVVFLVAVFGGFLLLGERGTSGGMEFSPELDLFLTAVSAAMAVVLGAILWVEGRHENGRTALMLSVGMLTIGVLALGLSEVARVAVAGEPGSRGEALSWSLLTGMSIYVVALAGVPARSPFRHAWVIPAIPTAIALYVAAAGLDAPGVLDLGLGALALALGMAYLGAGRGRYAWLAIAFVGFLLADVGRHLAVEPGSAWVVGVPVIEAIGLFFAIAGIVSEMASLTARSARELANSRNSLAALEAIWAATNRRTEERDHEARSALSAIEFAAMALKRRSGTLDVADLEQLELAMTAELALLRRLVTLPDAGTGLRSFSLVASLVGVVAAHRSRGLEVEMSVPDDLMVHGVPDACAEILQILLENATRHAPGSPVWIEAAIHGDWAILEVNDAGPGVPEGKRHLVFRRGLDAGHPSSATGRGLGLYLGEGLARSQGGVLWLDEAPGGGASFRLALKAVMHAHASGVPAGVVERAHIEG